MLTRRQTLQHLTVATALMASPAGIRMAFGAVPTDKRLVVVLLRGGIDGLAAIAPYGETSYRRTRGVLALPRPGEPGGLVDLDGQFGLHPALASLEPLYRSGDLAVAHAVGIPYRNRSHFDAQNVLENGTHLPHSTVDGWLNRAIGAMAPGDVPVGLAVGANVPLIMRGDARYTTYAPQVLPDVGTDFITRLERMYRQDPILTKTLADAVQAQAMKDDVLGQPRKGSRRDQGGAQAYFRESFGAAGKLLADRNGPRVAVLDTDGWDTHAFQGTTGGPLATQFENLATGLTQLRKGLGAAWQESVVAVLSEFGRTVAINGTKGTDHGTGSVALILGGAIKGGQMATTWPGLDPRHLFEGRDLAPATDIRALLKGILRDHMAVPEGDIEDRVFPDSRYVAGLPGLIRT